MGLNWPLRAQVHPWAKSEQKRRPPFFLPFSGRFLLWQNPAAEKVGHRRLIKEKKKTDALSFPSSLSSLKRRISTWEDKEEWKQNSTGPDYRRIKQRDDKEVYEWAPFKAKKRGRAGGLWVTEDETDEMISRISRSVSPANLVVCLRKNGWQETLFKVYLKRVLKKMAAHFPCRFGRVEHIVSTIMTHRG